MTKDDIIHMACEYSLSEEYTQFGWHPFSHYRFDENELIDFFALVAEKEREACAALCFQMWDKWLDSEDRSEFTRPDAEDCAAAIRARGQV